MSWPRLHPDLNIWMECVGGKGQGHVIGQFFWRLPRYMFIDFDRPGIAAFRNVLAIGSRGLPSLPGEFAGDRFASGLLPPALRLPVMHHKIGIARFPGRTRPGDPGYREISLIPAFGYPFSRFRRRRRGGRE